MSFYFIFHLALCSQGAGLKRTESNGFKTRGSGGRRQKISMKPTPARPESKRTSGSPECLPAESVLFPEHLLMLEVAGKPGGPLAQPCLTDVAAEVCRARERTGPGKAPCPRSAVGCLCTARPCCSLLSVWLSSLPAATEGFMSLRFGHCCGCNRGPLWSSVSSSLMQGLSCSLDLTLLGSLDGPLGDLCRVFPD